MLRYYTTYLSSSQRMTNGADSKHNPEFSGIINLIFKPGLHFFLNLI